MLCHWSSRLYRGLYYSVLFLWSFYCPPNLPSCLQLEALRFTLLSTAQMVFKIINITMPQSALIPFSGPNTSNSFPYCAMHAMICLLSLSASSSPTVHLTCSLTPEHHTPCWVVNNLGAHQAVSFFFPFSKTFLYLKYTFPLTQHRKLVLILQEPPTL